MRYAAGRDDRIVSAYENVVFETPQAGWYVESRAGEGRCGLDALALVERVGEVAFVADVCDRNTVSIRFTTYFLEVFENIWDKIWRN